MSAYTKYPLGMGTISFFDDPTMLRALRVAIWRPERRMCIALIAKKSFKDESKLEKAKLKQICKSLDVKIERF